MKMDYRLDLYNAVQQYENNMNEDDVLFILCHNKKEGDSLSAILGDVSVLSMMLSVDGYVKINTPTDRENLDSLKGNILNMAINIINTDKELYDAFIKSLKELKNGEVE